VTRYAFAGLNSKSNAAIGNRFLVWFQWHNGAAEMVVGTRVPQVEGGAIMVVAQALNDRTNGWMDSRIQGRMNWSNASDLQVMLNIHDNPPNGDLDFNDLVDLCTVAAAALFRLLSPRPDLTIPGGFMKGRLRSDRVPLCATAHRPDGWTAVFAGDRNARTRLRNR
jgi:hypothetical protein